MLKKFCSVLAKLRLEAGPNSKSSLYIGLLESVALVLRHRYSEAMV